MQDEKSKRNYQKYLNAKQYLKTERNMSETDVETAMSFCTFSTNYYSHGFEFNQYIFDGVIIDLQNGLSLEEIKQSVNEPESNVHWLE